MTKQAPDHIGRCAVAADQSMRTQLPQVARDGHRRDRQFRNIVLTLDRAITDEKELQTELATLLGAEIKQFTVQRVDQVRDTTLVDVRYRVRNAAPLARDTATEPTAHDALAN